MEELERLRGIFSKDLFATQAAGACITQAQPRRAVCEMPILPIHKNARGTVMGGAIFTLADFASAVAANYGLHNQTVISLQADISFLSAARGERLIAEADCVKHGRHTTCYQVSVRDELGTKVALLTMTGYTIDLQEKSL